ncbi:unnamed protein product [Amoebophrya sp. A120]|nr:unnamed protein product [Amoebophrya sp. A120]|eukprot:GSA120T00019020001.1
MMSAKIFGSLVVRLLAAYLLAVLDEASVVLLFARAATSSEPYNPPDHAVLPVSNSNGCLQIAGKHVQDFCGNVLCDLLEVNSALKKHYNTCLWPAPGEDSELLGTHPRKKRAAAYCALNCGLATCAQCICSHCVLQSSCAAAMLPAAAISQLTSSCCCEPCCCVQRTMTEGASALMLTSTIHAPNESLLRLGCCLSYTCTAQAQFCATQAAGCCCCIAGLSPVGRGLRVLKDRAHERAEREEAERRRLMASLFGSTPPDPVQMEDTPILSPHQRRRGTGFLSRTLST